jgi:8-oxo-dGTP diphosphatase
MTNPIDVVAAILIRADGACLMASRPEGKVYAGWWEFPGGKVEAGETLAQALAREIREELGLAVAPAAHPWIARLHVYEHATVRLHFFRIFDWRGEPHPHEGQGFAWVYPEAAGVEPILPANFPVLRALTLPPVYAITQARALGEADFMARLESALMGGTRLIQVREKDMPDAQLIDFTRRVVQQAHPHGARVLLNAAPELTRMAGADGVHLSGAALAALEARPDLPWVAASCHTRAELERAAALGLDFALLSPVLPTASHPGEPTLGWDNFAVWAADAPLPVYALGGMTPELLDEARAHGAHGIAMLRGAWA